MKKDGQVEFNLIANFNVRLFDVPTAMVAVAVANMRRALVLLAERAGAAEQARKAHGAGRAALQRGAHADEKRTRPPRDAVGTDARLAAALTTHRADEDEATRDSIQARWEERNEDDIRFSASELIVLFLKLPFFKTFSEQSNRPLPSRHVRQRCL